MSVESESNKVFTFLVAAVASVGIYKHLDTFGRPPNFDQAAHELLLRIKDNSNTNIFDISNGRSIKVVNSRRNNEGKFCATIIRIQPSVIDGKPVASGNRVICEQVYNAPAKPIYPSAHEQPITVLIP